MDQRKGKAKFSEMNNNKKITSKQGTQNNAEREVTIQRH